MKINVQGFGKRGWVDVAFLVFFIYCSRQSSYSSEIGFLPIHLSYLTAKSLKGGGVDLLPCSLMPSVCCKMGENERVNKT